MELSTSANASLTLNLTADSSQLLPCIEPCAGNCTVLPPSQLAASKPARKKLRRSDKQAKKVTPLLLYYLSSCVCPVPNKFYIISFASRVCVAARAFKPTSRFIINNNTLSRACTLQWNIVKLGFTSLYSLPAKLRFSQ